MRSGARRAVDRRRRRQCRRTTSAAANKDAKAVKVALGGGVGAGGDGERVLVDHNGDIATHGRGSDRDHRASVGGGGGNAGTDCRPARGRRAATVSRSPSAARAARAASAATYRESDGDLTTQATDRSACSRRAWATAAATSSSIGRLLQVGEKTTRARSRVSRSASRAASAARRRRRSESRRARIITHGTDAHAIHAQSVGGGGGGGGSRSNADSSKTTNPIAVGVGGSGGDGGTGGAVTVDNDAASRPTGDERARHLRADPSAVAAVPAATPGRSTCAGGFAKAPQPHDLGAGGRQGRHGAVRRARWT